MRITLAAILLCLVGCAHGLGRVPAELVDDRTTDGHRPDAQVAAARVPSLSERWAKAQDGREGPLPRGLLTHYALALEAAGQTDEAFALIVAHPLDADSEAQPIDPWWQVVSAALYLQSAQPEAAIPLAAVAADAFAHAEEPYGEAWARLLLGQAALAPGGQGEGVEVREELEAALSLAEALGDAPLAAQARAGLARTLVAEGLVEDGIKAAVRAVGEAATQSEAVRARVLWDAGQAALVAERPGVAVGWLEEAWVLVGGGAPSPTPSSVGVAVARARLMEGDAPGARRAAAASVSEVRSPAHAADLGRLWLDLARVSEDEGDDAGWADALVTAGSLCGQAGDLRCAGEALGQLARASFEAGALDDAVAWGREAAADLERSGALIDAARIWRLVGRAEVDRGDAPAAMLALQRARPALVAQAPAEGAAVEAELAVVALGLGRTEDAARYAASAADAAVDPLTRAKVEWVDGRVALIAEDGPAALRHLEAAATLAEDAGDARLAQAVHRELVAAAALVGDLPTLVRHGDAALALLKGVDDLFPLAWKVSAAQLAALPPMAPGAEAADPAHPPEDSGPAAEALEWHRSLLAWAREVGDGSLQTLAITGLAEVRRLQGRLVEASTLLEVALTDARAQDDRRGEGLALVALARVSVDKDRPDEAMALLRRSLPLLDGANPAALLLDARQLYQVILAASPRAEAN